MAQPIRKVVQEAHPESTATPFYTLLVDGTNLLRISFADTKINTKGEHYGAVYQFLYQLKSMMEKRPFDYVYVFFDDEDSGMLRYRIYHDYKANRDKNYADHDGISDYMKAFNEKVRQMQSYFNEKRRKERPKTDAEKLVDENFARERAILCRYFNELYIRWQMDEQTEGDDLISFYVHNKKPEERIFIMSTDEDLTQLISDTVCVYNVRQKKAYSTKNFKKEKGFPHENVVLKKIFLGDTSDNIGNIRGVSETRLLELMPEIKERPVTVNEVRDRAKQLCDERVKAKKKPLQWQENIVNGVANKNYDGDFYEINDKLINLDKPLLTKEAQDELSEMMYNAQDPDGRSFGNLYQYIVEDDIMELISDSAFSHFFVPYKELANKEIKRFERQYGSEKK